MLGRPLCCPAKPLELCLPLLPAYLLLMHLLTYLYTAAAKPAPRPANAATIEARQNSTNMPFSITSSTPTAAWCTGIEPGSGSYPYTVNNVNVK
jgi:hypothetical protein